MVAKIKVQNLELEGSVEVTNTLKTSGDFEIGSWFNAKRRDYYTRFTFGDTGLPYNYTYAYSTAVRVSGSLQAQGNLRSNANIIQDSAGSNNTPLGVNVSVTGNNNIAIGKDVVCDGDRNVIFGPHAIPGQRNGVLIFAPQQRSVPGDIQTVIAQQSARTDGAFGFSLTADNFGSAFSRGVLQNFSVQRVRGSLVAIDAATTDVGAWDVSFVCARGAGGPVIKGTPVVDQVINELGVVFDSTDITASTEGWSINVLGVAGKNIQWLFSTNPCPENTRAAI